MPKRLPSPAWLALRRAAASMLRARGTRSAAQIAFFLVLSFPATLLLLVWAFSALLNDDSVRKTIVDAIVHALPLADPADRRQVESLLDEVAAGAGAVGWVGAIALMYSASAAVSALRDAVNEAMGTGDPRPLVQGKALDIGLTLVVAPLTLVALGLNLSGELANAIGDHPWLAGLRAVPGHRRGAAGAPVRSSSPAVPGASRRGVKRPCCVARSAGRTRRRRGHLLRDGGLLRGLR